MLTPYIACIYWQIGQLMIWEFNGSLSAKPETQFCLEKRKCFQTVPKAKQTTAPGIVSCIYFKGELSDTAPSVCPMFLTDKRVSKSIPWILNLRCNTTNDHIIAKTILSLLARETALISRRYLCNKILVFAGNC